MRTYVAALGLAIAGCGDDTRPAGPETIIDQAPASLSATTHVAIAFHSPDELATFACSLDGGAAEACGSPWTIDVTDGAHAVSIVATNDLKLAGPAATADFTVDTVAPDTTIIAGPDPVVALAVASFSFAAQPVDTMTTFECAVDTAGFVPCVSPATVTRADGAHLFSVRAVDAAGNADPTPATLAWRIDTTLPAIAIHPPLIAPRTSDLQPTVFFTASDPTTCAVDSAAATACDGTAGFVAPATLAEGPHAYHITATDGATNHVTVDVDFVVDITPPSVTITGGPTDPTNDDTPTFTFVTSADTTRARCAMDTGEVVDPCTSPVTIGPLASGHRTFTVTAFDDAVPANSTIAAASFALGACGNGTIDAGEQCDGSDLGGASCQTQGFQTGALACSASCSFDTSGCSTCGDGVRSGGELCDGSDTGTATCATLGHAPGTLGCAATCDGFVTTGCDGGFTAANGGFSGRVCFDGVKYGRATSTYVAACAEDTGVWKSTLDPAPVWANANGTTAGSMVTNAHGRFLAPQPDGPAVQFLVDNAAGNNGYRSNTFEGAVGAVTWTAQFLFASGGTPIELFSAHPGSATNNLLGGWHPALGAVVLHGNFALTATASQVGAAVTGTVTSIASGVFSGVSTDINVAVYGKTPAGADAAGGGIYWSCDISGTAGGAFTEHDTGIAASDKPLVWSLTADPASASATQRTCPSTGLPVSGYATVYYAALRGGGQIYKTVDAGETWSQSNTGIPAGAEVYTIALDCSRFVAGFPNLCNNHELLYAATSVGLYQSIDAGAHWTLAGLEGKAVRGVTLPPDHPAGSSPRVFVGVDDATGIYQRNVP